MKDIFESGKVNYILRMYLPRWDFDRVIKDVVTYCQETGTEHVMLFTDAQMIVWNQLTIEEARKAATAKIDEIQEQFHACIQALDRIKMANRPSNPGVTAFNYDKAEMPHKVDNTEAMANGINLAPIKGQMQCIWPLMHFLKTEII